MLGSPGETPRSVSATYLGIGRPGPETQRLPWEAFPGVCQDTHPDPSARPALRPSPPATSQALRFSPIRPPFPQPQPNGNRHASRSFVSNFQTTREALSPAARLLPKLPACSHPTNGKFSPRPRAPEPPWRRSDFPAGSLDCPLAVVPQASRNRPADFHHENQPP